MTASLAWQGYRIETHAPDKSLSELIERGQWEFMILDLAAAELLPPPAPTDRPYRILLVAVGEPNDTVRALTNFGAVAVLETPPHPGVLAATLLSLCRRFGAMPPVTHENPQRRVGDNAGAWMLDATHWLLSGPDGRKVKLTHTETIFLLTLSKSPGEAVARSRLIAAMGHSTEYYDTRRLDTFVSRLRQKVLTSCAKPLPLRSVHAYGYAIASCIVAQE